MDCLFCDIVNNKKESFKIYEDDLVIAILDAFPNADGHTLIIPKKHYEDYIELPNLLYEHIMNVAKKLGPAIMEKLNSKALSIIVNYKDAQVIKHFHLHLIPDMKNKATKKPAEIYELLKDIKIN